MGIFHSRRTNHRISGDLAHHGLINVQLPQQRPKLFRGNAAGAEQPGPLPGHVHDGGFHAYPARAAVHNGLDLPGHIVIDVLRRGRAGLA